MIEIPTEKNVAVFRKYLTECVIIALCSCVLSLFLMYNNLNSFINQTLTKQLIESNRAIDRNTDAFNRLIK